jgi:insertion element IS1 protein InsB
VQNKSNQCWTWYAIERRTGQIIAYYNGKGTDDDYQKLLDKMSCFPIKRIYTDNWGAYSRLAPAHNTLLAKITHGKSNEKT